MKHSLMSRVLTMALTLAMTMSSVPMQVFATETEDTIETTSEMEAEVEDSVEDSETESVTETESAVETESVQETESVTETESIPVPEQKFALFSRMGRMLKAMNLEFEVRDDYYNLISKKDWDIAPGITEAEIVLNNDEGTRRQVLHIMEADMNNEYTKVIGSYAEMNTSKYQTSTMDKQAFWVENNWGLNVVGAMNTCLSWYSGYPADQVGKPLGFLMVDTEVLWGQSEGFPTVLVINKDEDAEGNARPADIPKVEMVQIKSEADLDGWEEQVIPCSSGYIVKDGVNQYSESRSDSAPRSVVGIKADGTVVIMENDGRQAPFSTGMTMYELAEVMIGLGCTYAVNCDGGGSSTFMSQRPGENLEVNNSPSDGGLRPTTQGILFISTAPSDGTFVRASVEADAQYYTPNSDVQFTAKGADFAGGAAEIPAEAVWQLSDDTFGTIDQNGYFVSNGKTGEVSAQIFYNDEVVGEFAINIVIPDSIQFSQSTLTVPNGETTTFGLSAKYGNIEVVTKDADFEVALDSEDMGVLDGYKLTATEVESVLGGSITATLTHDKNVTATMQVVYGKASEVVYDFENGFDDDWYVEWGHSRKKTTYGNPALGQYNNIVKSYAVTEENGMVHDGNGSAAVYVDNTRSTMNWSGARLNWAKETVEYKNATSIGAWVYIPKDAVSYGVRFMLTGTKDGKEVSIDATPHNFGDSLYFEESGWHYVSVDVSEYDSIILKQSRSYEEFLNSTGKDGFTILLTAQLNGGSSGEYDWTTAPGTRAITTIYLDNLTVDYSEACADKDEPIFENVKYVEPVTSEDKVLNNQRQETTVTKYNEIGFSVAVSENTGKVNATGLDASSAKAYIDGNAVNCAFNGSIMSIDSTELTNGVHTVKFVISDKAGNSSSVIRKINVQASNNDASIKVVTPEVENNMIFTGSQYSVDVVANEVEKVEKVTVTLDLNNNNEWILDHIETLSGFTTTYTTDVAEENTLYLTITRTGDVDASGEHAIVSVPIQTWTWKEEDYPGYVPKAGGDNDLNGNSMYDPYEIWKEYVTWNCDVIINPLAGNAEFTDGTEEWFSGDKIQVDTEQKIGTWWGASAAAKVYFAGKSSWHLHVAGEAQSKKATCTETGYENRVFCEGCACVTEKELGHACDSSEGCGAVLEWGTTVSAKGHSWEVVDGKLTCMNGGELFNGSYEGKDYVDGEVTADGWNGDKTAYYVDGVKLKGSHFLNGVMYTFDEDGTYLPNYKYEGFYEINDTIMYFISNEYLSGYHTINGEFYLFDQNGMGYDGEYQFCNINVKFEDAKPICDDAILTAGMCGDNIQFVICQDGRMIVDGTGEMYDYSNVSYNPWYADYRYNVTSLYVGKDITSIGDRTFYNLWYLEKITFEEGSKLKNINLVGLALNSRMKEIELPYGLQTIGDASFRECNKLEKIVIPSSVTSIAGNAFHKTSNVTLYVAKDSYAESYAKKYEMKYVNYEEEEKTLAAGSCGETAEWTLSSTGTLSISGSGAMTDYETRTAPWQDYKSMVKKIVIGKEITYVGKFAFMQCSNLEEIVFEESDKLKTIGWGAFGYCKSLKDVTIPSSVSELAAYAFYYCTSLETVSFEEGSELTTIGMYAFWQDTSIKTYYVPDKVVSIGENAFLGCKDTATFKVAEGTYSHDYFKENNLEVREPIAYDIATGECGENAEWTLSSTGTLSISGSGAMTDYETRTAPWQDYKSMVKKVVIGKEITYVGKFAFMQCSNLEEIVFEESDKLETIGWGAFGYCKSLKDVTIPSSVSELAAYAFYYCTSLETVSFEEGSELTTIGMYAFWQDTSIKTYYVPDKVVSIGENAFLGCKDTATFKVAEGTYSHDYFKENNLEVREPIAYDIATGECGENAEWTLSSTGTLSISGSGAMTDYETRTAPWQDYKSMVKKVVIGKEITYVGKFAFMQCSNLEEIVFEENDKLETIGWGAFGYCKSLKDVTIPSSVSELAAYAFYYCTSLETVSLEEDSKLKTIGMYAFWMDGALIRINCPENVVLGENVFLGSAIK